MKEQISENGDRELRVQTLCGSQNKDHLSPVNTDQNKPVVKAFRTGRPLWLLDANKEPPSKADRYKDHWHGLTRVTASQPPAPPVRRPVAVPWAAASGSVSTSSRSLITWSPFDVAVSELERPADALAILPVLWYVNHTQAGYTSEAIADLNQMQVAAKLRRAGQAALLRRILQAGGP